ncbi:RIKEN cDNA 9030611K07, isoform CRA_a [Mus musculus]|nr:RIKEN cDNA 9030611K07, isoform CRA_a [Mus musculus]
MSGLSAAGACMEHTEMTLLPEEKLKRKENTRKNLLQI